MTEIKLPDNGHGYAIVLDGKEYTGWSRGPRAGQPFTLVECWNEVRGTRNAHIVSLPTGRMVLANAGSMTVRNDEMPTLARRLRVHARNARSAYRRKPCPYCGHDCYQGTAGHGWWHSPRHANGCDVELFANHPMTRKAAA